MKVLITGGAGFIGQRTGEHLMKQGHQVTILDNLSPPAHDGPPALPAGIDLVEGDVRKREDWVKALKENEVVVHLADHHDYLPSFSKLFHVNAARWSAASGIHRARFAAVRSRRWSPTSQ